MITVKDVCSHAITFIPANFYFGSNAVEQIKLS